MLSGKASDSRDVTSLWMQSFHTKETAWLIYGLDVAVLEMNLRPASKLLNMLRKASGRTKSLQASCGAPSRLFRPWYSMLISTIPFDESSACFFQSASKAGIIVTGQSNGTRHDVESDVVLSRGHQQYTWYDQRRSLVPLGRERIWSRKHFGLILHTVSHAQEVSNHDCKLP